MLPYPGFTLPCQKRCFLTWGVVLGIIAIGLSGDPVSAQPFGQPRFPFDTLPRRIELSPDVTIPEADSTARNHLQQAEAYLAAEEWDEGIETLRRLIAEQGDALLPVVASDPDFPKTLRYLPLRHHAQRVLAGLPAEPLALYRRRVDPQAQRMYQTAVAARDASQLAQLLDEFFISSWGDDALLAYGELMLANGQTAAARAAWSRLLPSRSVSWQSIPAAFFESVRNHAPLRPEDAALLDNWYQRGGEGSRGVYALKPEPPLVEATAQSLRRLWTAQGWIPVLFYPDSQIPPADVAARLALVSILEGARDRAAVEIEEFRQNYGQAVGTLAAKDGNLAEILAGLLAESEGWQAPRLSNAWATFAANPQRSGRTAGEIDISTPAWNMPLAEVRLPDPRIGVRLGLRPRRVAEDSEQLLSYHPVVVGNRWFYCNEHQIFGFDLATGKPLWAAGPGRPAGELYRTAQMDRIPMSIQSLLGVPRYTLTVHGDRLYARMGLPITMPMTSRRLPLRGQSQLVCLDLAAQGALLWEYTPETSDWVLEGTALSDGARVYVGMRRSSTRAHAHVACFDADNGQLLWRTLVCSAATPGAGNVDEASHNLLTLADGMLFYNTNLGAVASLETATGKLRWITRYPRAEPNAPLDPGDNPAHYYRDLNPALYHQGKLFVAPADSPGIFALDATSGLLIWESSHRQDAVHLLGVAEGHLIATGDKVYGFAVHGGRLDYEYPAENHLPNGFGRGLLVGSTVYWPTRDELYALDAATGTPVRQPIPLDPRGVRGGNLVLAADFLLIAGSNKVWGFELPP